jgi:hypothetical protein
LKKQYQEISITHKTPFETSLLIFSQGNSAAAIGLDFACDHLIGVLNNSYLYTPSIQAAVGTVRYSFTRDPVLMAYVHASQGAALSNESFTPAILRRFFRRPIRG